MSSQVSKKRGFGEVTWLETVQVVGLVALLPAVLIRSYLASLVSRNSTKPWRRVLSDSASQYLSRHCNTQQTQFILRKSSLNTYKDWMKKKNLPINVEEVGQGTTRLLWIGRRQTQVLLYCHGGAFAMPLLDFMLDFLAYTQDGLKAKRVDASVAILNYSVISEKVFPSQLEEISAALSHLIESGTKPEDIQLIGDSAGGNLILQLISHIIHPLQGVPTLSLPGRLGGVLLISPWTSLQVEPRLITTHPANGTDIINFRGLLEWGQAVLDDVPESGVPYVDPIRAPESWFDGISNVTRRVLMTAGEKECLKDSVVVVGDRIKGSYPGGVELIVQKDAIHCDALCDFMIPGGKDQRVGEVTPIIISWIAEGFSGTTSS